jgi:hypothetical protein
MFLTSYRRRLRAAACEDLSPQKDGSETKAGHIADDRRSDAVWPLHVTNESGSVEFADPIETRQLSAGPSDRLLQAGKNVGAAFASVAPLSRSVSE